MNFVVLNTRIDNFVMKTIIHGLMISSNHGVQVEEKYTRRAAH